MEEINLQKIVAASIKIGTIATLKGLGLLSEIVIAADAEREYSKKLVDESITSNAPNWKPQAQWTHWATHFRQTKFSKTYFDENRLIETREFPEGGNVCPFCSLCCDLFYWRFER